MPSSSSSETSLLAGTRDDLVAELLEDGLPVMRDNDPLAMAHREIRAARDVRPRQRR
jgi:hypothetical protein